MKKLNKKRQITMTVQQIENMKTNATKRAVKVTQLFPLWVLRTKYGFGGKRLKDFHHFYEDLIDSFNKGYISLDDVEMALEEETGLKFMEDEDEL